MIVDVSSKADVYRYAEAVAEAQIGDRENCRAAAVVASGSAYRYIPLLHPVPISASAECDGNAVRLRAETVWKTGVEMDALFGALVGAMASGALSIKRLSVAVKVKGEGVVKSRGAPGVLRGVARPDLGYIVKAEGFIRLRSIDVVKRGVVEKGDPLCAARIAAALNSKRLCELLPVECAKLEYANAEARAEDDGVRVSTTVKARDISPSLEALFAAGVALLTIWDMTKKYEKDEGGQYPYTFIELGLSM